VQGERFELSKALGHRISRTDSISAHVSVNAFSRVPIWSAKKGSLSPAHLTGLWYPCERLGAAKAYISRACFLP